MIEELRERQRKAAEDIVSAHAGLLALAGVARTHIEGGVASVRAFEGVTGSGSLIGWRNEIPVPQEIVGALRTVESKTDAVRGILATVQTSHR